MIEKLTKCAATIWFLLAFSIPAAAFERAQAAWWVGSEQPIVVVNTTDLFNSVEYEADSKHNVTTSADSRGIGLKPYMQLTNDVINRGDENNVFSLAAMDGRGIGLKPLNAVYAALEDGATIEKVLVEGWGNSFQTGSQFGVHTPTLDSATAYNPKIMFDGRGVGLQQANLSTDTLFSIAIAAVEIGNF